MVVLIIYDVKLTFDQIYRHPFIGFGSISEKKRSPYLENECQTLMGSQTMVCEAWIIVHKLEVVGSRVC